MKKLCVGVVSVYEFGSYSLPFTDLGLSVMPIHAADQIRDCVDIVCFTGGEDVSPYMYGEEPHPATYSDKYRDEAEALIYEKCLRLDIPMVGICRGSQFLNVMNGGKLHQDIDNHAIRGYHECMDVYGKTRDVTSTHHQASILTEKAIRLAWHPVDNITEAFYYPITKCLGVQFHPEYVEKGHECRYFFDQLMKDFIL
jgi:gamma-glutamyl-gamma-aminobutyrate hydrolase PuuD